MKLILEQIAKRFGEKRVLEDATFTFEQGRIYGLLGRTGAGKTTLFNCVSGEFPSDGGRVLLEEDGGAVRPLKETDVGYVLSTPFVPDFLTGYEFVRFFQEVSGGKGGGLTPDQWLELVGIEADDRHRLMKDYSHGMKNKMQMLCFLIAKPPVILLDEPLTSFDVVAAAAMKELLREMKREHVIIFSTHILELAADLCDEIVLLTRGELEAVDAALIHTPEFEQRVVELLKEESHV